MDNVEWAEIWTGPKQGRLTAVCVSTENGLALLCCSLFDSAGSFWSNKAQAQVQFRITPTLLGVVYSSWRDWRCFTKLTDVELYMNEHIIGLNTSDRAITLRDATGQMVWRLWADEMQTDANHLQVSLDPLVPFKATIHAGELPPNLPGGNSKPLPETGGVYMLEVDAGLFIDRPEEIQENVTVVVPVGATCGDFNFSCGPGRRHIDNATLVRCASRDACTELDDNLTCCEDVIVDMLNVTACINGSNCSNDTEELELTARRLMGLEPTLEIQTVTYLEVAGSPMLSVDFRVCETRYQDLAGRSARIYVPLEVKRSVITGRLRPQLFEAYIPTTADEIQIVICVSGTNDNSDHSGRTLLAVPAAVRATTRTAGCRGCRAKRRSNGQPDWVPKQEVLAELASSARATGYYCLREPGSSETMATICEVRGPSSWESERRFQLKISDEVQGFVVNELPFSEGKLGGHLWDGGILMSGWCACHSELFHQERVLELGSGIGLLGLCLSRLVGSGTVVLSDFGGDNDAGAGDRLVPARLLENLRDNVAINGITNAEVRHIDWHDFLPDAVKQLQVEKFRRLVAADVVYYSSDVPALASTIGAHLCPHGQAFVLVVRRTWTGSQAGERASAEDLANALKPFGEVTVSELLGYCCTFDEVPLALITLIRSP
eukprot:symbB.v1.2.011293.t1/scaffold735.1/size167969/1